MYNFIYLLNIYDVKVGDCYHFIESRTVLVTCPKSHNQVKTKIPDLQTFLALGYNLWVVIDRPESL